MALRYCLRLRDTRLEKTPAALEAAVKTIGSGAVGWRFLRVSDFTRGDAANGVHDQAMVQLAFDDAAAVKNFVEKARPWIDRHDDLPFGRDPRLFFADAWDPFGADGGIFGTRAMAHDLIGRSGLPAEARGAGVNVVIVDMGLGAEQLRADRRRFGSSDVAQGFELAGWSRDQLTADGHPGKGGKTSGTLAGQFASEHAHMVARSVLALAPEARIWDVPLVADEVVPPSLSVAAGLLDRVRKHVEACRDTNEPWIIVNAWGLMNSADFGHEDFDYGDNPDHVTFAAIPGLEAAGVDLLFAAMNCGEPCPDSRCGPNDRGPGRSIMGLNAHPCVLTVGAVRTDGLPVAVSSQGPGRLAGRWKASKAAQGLKPADEYAQAAYEKPDIAAPSHFTEDDDDAQTSRGSSAAIGVAAGVVAALRSIEAYRRVTPAAMRRALRAGAGARWDPRIGYGILNVPRTIAELNRALNSARAASATT